MAIQAHLYTYPSNTTGFQSSCGSQDLITDFNSQQNHHHQHQQLASSVKHVQPLEQHHQPLHLLLVNSNSDSNAYNATNNYNSNHLSTPISQSFPLEFQSQRTQVDHYIRSQNERLRIMLQEQRKQQVGALVKKVEMDALRMLREKEEQIAEAGKKRAELEEFLTRLEAENASWRRVAQEKEAMVLSLHNTLEQKQMQMQMNKKNKNGVETEDAESWCGEEGTGENRGCRIMMMECRRCKSGRSCLMFLPCRHLCSCKPCEPFLDACPLCLTPKKSTIQTLL